MNFTNPTDWGLAHEMNKLQKLKEENALLRKEIKRINNEKIKCDKDIKAMTRDIRHYQGDISKINKAKIECQKKLIVAEENAKLHTNRVLLERIEVLKEQNTQLRDQVQQLEIDIGSENRTYHSSVSHHRRSHNRSRSGGKTNKKIKSKRKHTRKRF